MSDDIKKEAGRQGGLARKDALSAEERKAIAQIAALARWGAKATHKGNFQEQFGIDVDCYVLDDAGKTAVISQRGMGAALGMGISGGSRLPRLVNSKAMADYIGPDLRKKLDNPLIFQAFTGGPNPPPSKVNGYDVTNLIDVCKAVIAAKADGRLIKPEIVKQAHIILSASAKAGIKGLVYALAGYDPTREEVIEAFKYYVRQEARDYEREFPPQLYAEWYRLYQLQKPVRGRPWKAKHLTIDHVYNPLARSNGKILKLTREQNSEHPGDKLHQFLSEIGVKTLRTHLGQILGIARISKTQEEYEQHVDTLFGVQQDMFKNPN